jgi:hypothetical protein
MFKFSLDIWSSDSTVPAISSSVTGYTKKLGGICNNDYKYSILEFYGFHQIKNGAHELGHRFSNYFTFKSIKI